MFAVEDQENQKPGTASQSAASKGAAADAPPADKEKSHVKLSYEEYKQMANLLALYMRRRDDELEDAGG